MTEIIDTQDLYEETHWLEKVTATAFIGTSEKLEEMRVYLDDVGERIASKLERAKRYREQAERRAKPLEASAKFLLDSIKPILIQYAQAKLPKYQSGDNVGKYKSKTLDLETARFSFKKVGGTFIFNDEKAMDFINDNYDKYPELDRFVETKTSIDKSALAEFLKNWENQEEILAFMSNVPDNDFAEVKCVVE